MNTSNLFYTYELCSSATPTIPFYIGKGKGNRMQCHAKNALRNKCCNKYLQRKILKILKEGNDVICNKITNDCSEDFAFEIEKEMIAYCKSVGIKLCNHTDGGEGSSGYKHTEETKKQLKTYIPWCKGKKLGPKSEESKKKQSISMKGKVSPNKGKHASEETVNKQRKAHLGKSNGPHTEETKNKISESNKGQIPWIKNKHHTEKSKKKQSEAKFGKNNPIYGKHPIPWNKGLRGYKQNLKRNNK
jgi:hypothetical protein